MEDGGLVVMSAPANPFRCPPGPYERASLIAYWLKIWKPKSKLLILDAKDAFSKQRLFQNAWAQLYPGLIEWVSLSQGGKVTSVDPSTLTFVTDFDRHKAAVGNVIPPQKAGAIAAQAGVADRTGWCPVEPVAFESTLQPGIHVLGDAAIMGGMPKSAFAANAQAKVCAAAIVELLGGRASRSIRSLINTCYSLVAPDYGIVDRRRLSAREGAAGRRSRRRRHQPARGRGRLARPGGALRRQLVPDDHRRDLRMKRCCERACSSSSRLPLSLRPGRRTDRATMSWWAMPFPSRLPAQPGDAARGRAIVANRSVGLCLLCHSGPIPEERFQGTLAPSLAGAGSRWRRASSGCARRRRASQSRHDHAALLSDRPACTRVAKTFEGKTILTAEQIEDVVAYLATLKE